MTPNTDIATRAFIVSLKAPCSGKTSAEVAELSGLSIRQVNRIYARAIERGFDPNIRPLIFKDEYLQDAPRSGRPTKATEGTKDLVVSKRAQRSRNRNLCISRLSDAGLFRISEDKANEEAGIDKDDES
ncbi:hypothetical protein DER46DRAFT_653730 [Fusarium sp. MPI-SDFR-AT-0072]|uniref:Uncharacterized protein n=1 Tax=Fusarium oxysporum f. sp. rapae TaxID=485398 RepID=A0A8J5PM59_FUSOX|nr:hypothetical protein Forpe1208_v001349 [Fusarium oxysporum f. sp. rapae]KAH7181568.1 hypothetical protein DER46DRAFT_653730 [Fusarium sp. MPI-SDFR-AT-0072]